MKIFLLFVLICLFLNQNNFAQSNKLVDGFISNAYYFSTINNAGTVNTTINDSDFTEGNSSLQVDYSFNAGTGSFFTVMRNYYDYTQHVGIEDYSFMPDHFSVKIKGGNAGDKIQLRFWEDINMDGVFNDSDEVYVSSESYLLGDSSAWQEVTFQLNNFTRVAGSGNNKLDLNRIRAWDFDISDSSGNSHSSVLYLDDLRFYTSYTPPQSTNALLTGSFIQLWNTAGCTCGQWTQDQWNTQIQQMKDVQLNKIIIQYGVYNDLAWYTPSSLSFITSQDSTLNKIFTAAEANGLKVFVGLYFDDTWSTSDKTSQSTYTALSVKHKAVIDEIYNLFGTSVAFGGWYIPQEIDDYNFWDSNVKTLLFNWLQDVASYAHSKTPDKPVIISPFFNLWMPADVLGSWYNDMLTAVNDVDFIYPQDGVGSTITNADVDVPNYFNHFKTVYDAHGKKFGAVLESFQQLTGWPIDNGSFTATSATIDRLKSQIAEESLYNPNDLIQFEWAYMEPGLNTSSKQFYADYNTYQTNTVSVTDIEFNTKDNFIIYPNPSEDIITLKNISNVNSVRLFDLTGKEQPVELFEKNSILVNHLNSGVYIVKVVNNSNVESRQLFIKK